MPAHEARHIFFRLFIDVCSCSHSVLICDGGVFFVLMTQQLPTALFQFSFSLFLNSLVFAHEPPSEFHHIGRRIINDLASFEHERFARALVHANAASDASLDIEYGHLSGLVVRQGRFLKLQGLHRTALDAQAAAFAGLRRDRQSSPWQEMFHSKATSRAHRTRYCLNRLLCEYLSIYCEVPEWFLTSPFRRPAWC